MTSRARWALVGAASLFAGLQASAHELKSALTEILFNPRSGHVEIAHRFIIHDAEHASDAGRGEAVDLAGDPVARRRFARRVASQFAIADASGTPYDLTLVGSEIENGYLWVYQEIDIDTVSTDTILIRQDALRAHWPDQVNRVNVRRASEVRSLRFTGADGFKPAHLGAE